MRVRLAGIPASYTLATDVMVIDEAGIRYLVSDDQPHVVRLNRTDAMLVAGFYEPVPENPWREIDTFFKDANIGGEAEHPATPVEPAAVI